MNSKEFPLLLEILEKSNPSERVDFLLWKENDDEQMRGNKLLLFWFFYFCNNFQAPLGRFHYEWILAYGGSKSIFMKWFRWSLKTQLAIAYVVFSIAYRRHKFIVWQSYESSSSEDNLRNIARMLLSKKLSKDFWELFPLSSPREDLSKKSIWNFNATNGVKVMARSLGENLRGANSYEEVSWVSRPDLVVIDDIDVSKSVENKDIIDKNYTKLTQETIGASDLNQRIIFLWNVIRKDGIVPRFESLAIANEKYWEHFVQAIYNDDWSISWDAFTEEIIEEKRAVQDEWFNQNYLLIPNNRENSLIKEHELRYYDYLSLDDFDSLYMHSDTTHTGKTTSDYHCTTIIWESKKDKNFYIVDFFLKKCDVEEQARSVISLYSKYGKKIKKMTYDEKSNNGFGYWVKKLAREEYNVSLPLEELKYPSDKVAHFEPHVPHFRSNRVYLPSGHNMIKTAVDQLLAFPMKWVHDDFIDWISGAMDNFHSKKKIYI